MKIEYTFHWIKQKRFRLEITDDIIELCILNSGKFKDRKIALIAVLAFLVIALVITGLFFYPGVFKGGQKSLNSIAVLPLKNLSGISTQEYLSDGMTEALISNLAQMEALERVISSTSVMQYKNVTKPLPEIPGNWVWMPLWKDQSWFPARKSR